MFRCFISSPLTEIIQTIYPVMHSSVHQSLVVITNQILEFPRVFKFKDSEILKAPFDGKVMRRRVDYPALVGL
jgi:hypothetical protein